MGLRRVDSTRKQDNVNTTTNTTTNKEWPLIHVVNTRFMQHQGHLETLARARLYLFQTFCLPTIINQSTQHFVWVIKTDPNLDENVKNDLIALLQPYPHFFLVGSNTNFGTRVEGGSWRDGSEGHDILVESEVYTGDITLLRKAYAQRLQKPILETRLDADDGIHKLYLQYIQYSAMKDLGTEGRNWLYWCSRRHVEWYASFSKPEGLVNPVEHEKLCITPGITVGYSVGIDTVPLYDHDVLYKEIQAHGGCHSSASPKNKNMDCIHLVDDLSFVAVRSRTPTSAGMMDVQLEKEVLKKDGVELMWKALDKLFFISRQQAIETNAFVLDNLSDIAKDNLKGQCTKGHSCKNSSVVLLQKLIQDGGNEVSDESNDESMEV